MSHIFTSNYHTHTALCHHASGEIRDYAIAAVEAGLTTLGYSCHAPYPFNNGYVSWFRMLPNEAKAYADEINALKEEFRGTLDIKLGYEAEYYPLHFKDLLDLINSLGCDYIILGQHFVNNEHDGSYSGDAMDGLAHVEPYVRQVTEAMRLGVYSYVAHPDLPPDMGMTDLYLEKMSEICRVSLETDTPLEINILGIQGNRQYPNDAFWKMVGEFGCKTVIGYDAHSPKALLDKDALARAFRMVDEYKLNYVEDITLKRPALDVK